MAQSPLRMLNMPVTSLAGLGAKARAARLYAGSFWHPESLDAVDGAAVRIVDDALALAGAAGLVVDPRVPAPAPVIERPSVVLDAARRFHAAIREADRLAVASNERAGDRPGALTTARQHDRLSKGAWAQQEAEREIIAAHSAETLAEAAVQLMIVHSDVENHFGPGLSMEEADKIGGRIEDLLRSALRVAIRESGVDLREFSGEYCLHESMLSPTADSEP